MMKLQYSCCHPLQQLIFVRSLSTSKRPPKLGHERTQIVQRQAPRLNVLAAPHFKYHEMAQNHFKKIHGGLIPHVLINFTGIGFPLLDYPSLTFFSVPAVLAIIAYPLWMYGGSKVIVSLSIDAQKKNIFLSTASRIDYTIPITQCSLQEGSLKICDKSFSFYYGCDYNHNTFKVLEEELLKSSESSGTFSYNGFSGIVDKKYLIAFVLSLSLMATIYLYNGCTDPAYLIFLFGILQEKILGRNFAKESLSDKVIIDGII